MHCLISMPGVGVVLSDSDTLLVRCAQLLTLPKELERLTSLRRLALNGLLHTSAMLLSFPLASNLTSLEIVQTVRH